MTIYCECTVCGRDIWLEAHKHLTTSMTFFFFPTYLFGKDFRNKSFTTCFTTSVPSKLPVFVTPEKSVLVDIPKLTFLALCYISLYFSFYKVRLRETERRSNLYTLSILITFISGIIIFSTSLFLITLF